MYPYQEIEKVHKEFRSELVTDWRQTGMLDETVPGSWEETTLAYLLENQRCIQEC